MGHLYIWTFSPEYVKLVHLWVGTIRTGPTGSRSDPPPPPLPRGLIQEVHSCYCPPCFLLQRGEGLEGGVGGGLLGEGREGGKEGTAEEEGLRVEVEAPPETFV